MSDQSPYANTQTNIAQLDKVECAIFHYPQCVATNQMLTLAQRLLTETPDLQRVVLLRMSTLDAKKTVSVTLTKDGPFKIKEEWSMF